VLGSFGDFFKEKTAVVRVPEAAWKTKKNT
jgi:hypothetical protein